MSKRKTTKERHEEWLKDPEYAKAYADLEPEFQIASAVIEARKIAGLTQAELADRMDTTQTAIARLESGTSLPSTRTLSRVAEAAGLKMHFGFTVIGKKVRSGVVRESSSGRIGSKVAKELAGSVLAQKPKAGTSSSAASLRPMKRK
jgi:transcriptional regulator with XRE-family HTH domain